MRLPNIKNRTYDLLFVLAIIIIVLVLVFTVQSLAYGVTIIDIKYPASINQGQAFKVQVFFQSSGHNLIVILQGKIMTGQAGVLGAFAQTEISLPNPSKSNATLTFPPMTASLTKFGVLIEFLTPIGQSIASQTVTINVTSINATG